MTLPKPDFSCFTHALLNTLSFILWSCYNTLIGFSSSSAPYLWVTLSAVSTVCELMTHRCKRLFPGFSLSALGKFLARLLDGTSIAPMQHSKREHSASHQVSPPLFPPDQKHGSLQFHLRRVKLKRKMGLLFPKRATTCEQSSKRKRTLNSHLPLGC